MERLKMEAPPFCISYIDTIPNVLPYPLLVYTVLYSFSFIRILCSKSKAIQVSSDIKTPTASFFHSSVTPNLYLTIPFATVYVFLCSSLSFNYFLKNKHIGRPLEWWIRWLDPSSNLWLSVLERVPGTRSKILTEGIEEKWWQVTISMGGALLLSSSLSVVSAWTVYQNFFSKKASL